MNNYRQKILIVEDEDLVAMDLEQTIDSLGYDAVGVASSGAQAIHLAETSCPDLVLMDIQLKGAMDGVTAAHEIRTRFRIPVVFVTANANDETLTRATATVPYGYLIKPFRSPELNATILVALQQHRALLQTSTDREHERIQLEEQVQTAAEALGQTRTELRALSGHLIRAQEEERRRLARDLHDDFGQRTALLDLLTQQLGQLLPEHNGAQETLGSIREQIATLSDGLRQVSHTLHPSLLNDLGLLPALRSLVSDFQQSGIEIVLQPTNLSGEIPNDVATALYRITQEALRNVVKHSAGGPVRISLLEKNAQWQLSIEDAGPGFCLAEAKAKGGLGLLSMQERARLANGTMLVRTAPGQGTRIVVRIPFHSPNSREDPSGA